jgi:uncharacterized protein DUF6152
MMTTLLLSVLLLAHHGDAGRYEDNLTLLTGTVVELQFINPHSLIVMDVTDDAGKTVRWRAELGGPAGLIKQFGWNKTTLKAGDKISVVGRRVKSGSPYINLTEMAKIVMADTGKEIFHTNNALPGLNLH